ncbi:MAG: hypothetical protein QOD52_1998 [Gaiellaceae bacterium]|nr:hypothetical protein [Gaiellaceae bacterium]
MSDMSSKGYTRRTGPRDRRLRVGDNEREAVAGVLREQHLQGRLTSDEFQERLDRCLTATTYAELDALVEDFPAHEEGSRHGWGWGPWPFALVALVVVAIAASGGHLFWLAFPLVFFFVLRPLVWHTRGFRGHRMWTCGPRSTTGGPA